MAKGKHRGCKWLHKYRLVGVLASNAELALFRAVCSRCRRVTCKVG